MHESPVPRAVRVVAQELHGEVVLHGAVVEDGHAVQVAQVLVVVLVRLPDLEQGFQSITTRFTLHSVSFIRDTEIET